MRIWVLEGPQNTKLTNPMVSKKKAFDYLMRIALRYMEAEPARHSFTVGRYADGYVFTLQGGADNFSYTMTGQRVSL